MTRTLTIISGTGGDVFIVVTSTSENKAGAIREAFQQTFGKAMVMGKVCSLFVFLTLNC